MARPAKLEKTAQMVNPCKIATFARSIPPSSKRGGLEAYTMLSNRNADTVTAENGLTSDKLAVLLVTWRLERSNKSRLPQLCTAAAAAPSKAARIVSHFHWYAVGAAGVAAVEVAERCRAPARWPIPMPRSDFLEDALIACRYAAAVNSSVSFDWSTQDRLVSSEHAVPYNDNVDFLPS